VDAAIADKSQVIFEVRGSTSGTLHEYEFCAWEYNIF
jgi:hypothetical protein